MRSHIFFAAHATRQTPRILHQSRRRCDGRRGVREDAVDCVPVLRDRVVVPVGRLLERALEPVVKVDADETEVGREAIGPPKVVEQRPHAVPAHVGAVFDGLVDRRKVLLEEVDATVVVQSLFP